jgi:hypothetical protein
MFFYVCSRNYIPRSKEEYALRMISEELHVNNITERIQLGNNMKQQNNNRKFSEINRICRPLSKEEKTTY